jgi:ribonuclease-3
VNFIRKLLGLDSPKPPAKGSARDRDFDLRGLERILHYNFKNPALARQAMTHRSYLHATPGRSGESNERMEFLGDSVVGLVVNEFLYKKFTKLREGELTKMKSLLVSRVILSRSANQLGLGHYILLSDAEKGSGGRNRASILADTLEGVIGAMYLDGGIEPARKVTERLLLREVNSILSDANLANYKSMLQEYVQGEFKTHPQYRISSEYGPDHQKMFTVEVVVSGKTYGRGHGSNKKEAEQEAARDALFHFEKLAHPVKEKGAVEEEKGAAALAPGDPRRRRRRGGRGRRNGRGREGGETPAAASGASHAGSGGSHGRHSAGSAGEHRGRRSRDRDRDREVPRDRETPRDFDPERAPARDETPRDHESGDYDIPQEHEARERESREHEPREHEPRDHDRDHEPRDRGGRDRDHEPSSDDSPSHDRERSGEKPDSGHGSPYAAARLHE